LWVWSTLNHPIPVPRINPGSMSLTSDKSSYTSVFHIRGGRSQAYTVSCPVSFKDEYDAGPYRDARPLLSKILGIGASQASQSPSQAQRAEGTAQRRRGTQTATPPASRQSSQAQQVGAP
jgi:hypothetical protein